jgi:hypothetical protein
MINMGVGRYVGAQVWNVRDICVLQIDRPGMWLRIEPSRRQDARLPLVRESPMRRVWQTEHTAGEIQEAAVAAGTIRKIGCWPSRMFGALVPNISGSMGTDCGPLRRRHSAEKAVPLPSAARRLLNLLLTEGWGYRRGVVHERDRSIKEDKKCGEPAGGP